jgi:hypothetical protein
MLHGIYLQIKLKESDRTEIWLVWSGDLGVHMIMNNISGQ